MKKYKGSYFIKSYSKSFKCNPEYSRGHAKGRAGFTLIELLVVIAIIGILASVVLASLSSARSKGSDAAVQATMVNVRSQAELYYSSNNNSYANVCGTTLVGGVKPIGDMLLSAGKATGSASVQSDVVIVLATGGAWNKVTCHENGASWVAEAPLKSSASGTPVMWCVDSTGVSKKETGGTANIGANIVACS